MGIFDTLDSENPVSLAIPRITVYVSSITWPETPTGDPTWGNWTLQPYLQALGCFRGSSFAGMSYATIKVSPGRPLDIDDKRIEQVPSLAAGDRVAICRGLKDDPDFLVLFCGYHTQANLNLDSQAESFTLRLMGPEWWWGDAAGGGSSDPILGQWRRNASGDTEYITAPASVTSRENLYNVISEKAIFNPDGRRNASTQTAELTSGDDPIEGTIWESPDRTRMGSLIARHWTMDDAAETLLTLYNDPDVTGISLPDNYGAIFSSDPLRSVNVDGMGLWAALRTLLEPRYGFFVRPVQPNLDANNWGPFTFEFFQRSNGTELAIPFNAFGTNITAASHSINRLEAMKDISRTVTQVRVIGHELKQVRLQYHGSSTNSITGDTKKLSLQHGWAKQEGDLADFDDATGNVTLSSIGELESASYDVWTQRHVIGGRLFNRYAHVFRLFVWNEAAEWFSSSQTPKYGSTDFAWYAPVLTSVVESTGSEVGNYARCRRPLRDTAYKQAGVDGWIRVPPQVYLKAIDASSATESPWFRLPTSVYRLDPDRAALWITAPDIAAWYPMDDVGWIWPITAPFAVPRADGRSFATLLHSGKLRLMLEACIELDEPLDANETRSALAGSPFKRTAVIRRDEYIKVTEFSDGITSPGGMTAELVDATTEAEEFATNQRIAGQDQQCHASITLEPDWPEIAIGTMITGTAGREIDLTGGPAARGAQVVAQYLDFQSFKWEMLTESVAMQLRDSDRALIGSTRSIRQRRRGDGLP